MAGESVTVNETAWILKNGTFLAVDHPGQNGEVNDTGVNASNDALGFVSGFYFGVVFGDNQSLLANGTESIHSTGTSTVTIGGSHVTVTNYTGTASEQVAAGCVNTESSASFALSIGTPVGASFPIVTSATLEESVTASGSTTTIDIKLQMTAFTVAA